MSYAQDYFPPNGTKYKWHPKALSYCPWTCRPYDSGSAWDHPTAVATVHLVNSSFEWRVEIRDWYGKWTTQEGEAPTALEACLAAETVCDAEKAKLWLPWMEEAVKAGWRPPNWG